jgi:hypothetical protein
MMDEFYCPTSAAGRSLRCNFRSSAPKTPPPPKQEPIKFPKMPKIHIPPMPEPQPVAPPPTATSADVAQAEEQSRRDLNKRKGLKKTVLAGETGGYNAQLGGATILGGPTGNA